MKRVVDAFYLIEDIGEVISWELREGGRHTVIKQTPASYRREGTAIFTTISNGIGWDEEEAGGSS